MPGRRLALISVTHKEGAPEFAKKLLELEFVDGIISTGGTADKLREAGIEVIDSETYTGMEQSPLLKTMHHLIYAALFYAGDDEDSAKMRETLSADQIPIVVGNFYDFKGEGPLEQSIPGMDCGGPTFVRVAAKMGLLNGSVAAVTSPGQYESICEVIDNCGKIPVEMIHNLAVKALEVLHAYDEPIIQYLRETVPSNPQFEI